MITTKRLEVDDLFIKDSSKPRTSIHVKTFGSNYTPAAVAAHPKSVFIFSGNTKSRAIGAPATSGQESIRGLKILSKLMVLRVRILLRINLRQQIIY